MISPDSDLTRPADPSAATGQDRLLDQLAAILAEQKTKAQQGDLLAVQNLLGKSDALLHRLADAGPLTTRSASTLAEISQVHQQIRLILAAAKQDAADRINRLVQGKTALRAYDRR